MQKFLDEFPLLSTDQAFEFYESVRHRLPQSNFLIKPTYASNLETLIDNFDVFVFDAYGVLNVGTEQIMGASECIAKLKKLDKQVFVLTNGAGLSQVRIESKFRNLGFDFASFEVISSRMLAEQALLYHHEVKLWGVISAFSQLETDLPVPFVILGEQRKHYEKVGGFLFLSSGGLNALQLTYLKDSLSSNTRPFIVANPDVVAPQGDFLSLEPGFFSHQLANQLGIVPEFYGKPFSTAYRCVEKYIHNKVEKRRIVMVGDTLHTDILGGAAMGWSTILVKDYGLFAGQDVMRYIDKSGIIPNWIIPSL